MSTRCRIVRWPRWVTGAALALWLASSARAADTNITFDQANKLYEEGKFRDAATAYSQMISAGQRSAALFFNLGNARFKSGQNGRAIAAYRQAGQLAPRDPDVRANLRFARNQVAGPTLRMGLRHRVIESLTTNEWTLLALGPAWALFALLIAARLKPARRASLRGATITAGALSLLGGVALGVVLNHRLTERTVVVIARDTVVRHGPLEESQSAFTAADGAELRLLDAKDDWLQVSDGDRRTGWLKTNSVERIN